MRLHVTFDPDFGAVAAAVDDDGTIVATAASHAEHGIYVAVDEAAVFEATGQLIPLPDWERCKDRP